MGCADDSHGHAGNHKHQHTSNRSTPYRTVQNSILLYHIVSYRILRHHPSLRGTRHVARPPRPMSCHPRLGPSVRPYHGGIEPTRRSALEGRERFCRRRRRMHHHLQECRPPTHRRPCRGSNSSGRRAAAQTTASPLVDAAHHVTQVVAGLAVTTTAMDGSWTPACAVPTDDTRDASRDDDDHHQHHQHHRHHHRHSAEPPAPRPLPLHHLPGQSRPRRRQPRPRPSPPSPATGPRTLSQPAGGAQRFFSRPAIPPRSSSRFHLRSFLPSTTPARNYHNAEHPRPEALRLLLPPLPLPGCPRRRPA